MNKWINHWPSLRIECYSFNLQSLQSVIMLSLTYVLNHLIISRIFNFDRLAVSQFQVKNFIKTQDIPQKEIETGAILIHLYFSQFIYSHAVKHTAKLNNVPPFSPKMFWLRCWQNVISAINNFWWLFGTWNKIQILFQFIIPKTNKF